MTLSFPSPEFDDAVAAVCHGTATEETARALNALLRSRSDARDEYLLRLALHARLASDPDLFVQPGTGEPLASRGNEGRDTGPTNARPFDEPRTESRRPAPCPPGAGRPRSFRPATGIVALAAGFAVLAGGWWGWHAWRRPDDRRGAAHGTVALLTRVVEARWTGDGEAPRVGSALNPGRLRLESGLAQVVFYSGARLVIEGPADLRLVSTTEAVCSTGRLIAEVPSPARGFRLQTDQISVVDLGTAFGIDVAPGRTEVHVFGGRVELRPGTASKTSLGEGQAAVVQGRAPPRLMAANATDFASMLEFQQRSLISEAIRHEQWQFANARLRRDPTALVHLDFEHLDGTDWTLRNAAERNASVPEATIVGCQRTAGRWREKQALEFTGPNDRVRLVVPGEFDTLTLSAWTRLAGLDRQFNSLFMSDGFEPGTIHWLIRHDGVLGLTVFGSEPGRFRILASPPVITPDDFGQWLHLAVVLDGTAREAVHYVNGEPVSRHPLDLGPPYRIGLAELGNWNAHGDPLPTPDRIRNLSAALDEFTLFDRALSDAGIRALYDEGKPQP